MTAALRKAFPGENRTFFESLFKTPWVVFAKRPFAGPESVIAYLGRYTHKIAISNHRLVSVTDDQVTFHYKDYRNAGVKKHMSLPPMEFIRRFALHILPRGFVRIRHYGILSSRRKALVIPQVVLQLTGRVMQLEKYKRRKAPARVCPCCKKALMQTILRFDHRGPPPILKSVLIKSLRHVA
jgi:hypothetical protein